MATQSERAETFASLHVKGRPVVLFNIWDAGSAQAVARTGATALATGSWPVAAAHGAGDGEHLSLDLALANLERIVAAVDLPVSLDFESGYGRTADQVAANAGRVVTAGAVGINLEDRIIGEDGLYASPDHAARVAGAVQADLTAVISPRRTGRRAHQLWTRPLASRHGLSRRGCDRSPGRCGVTRQVWPEAGQLRFNPCRAPSVQRAARRFLLSGC